MIALVSQLFSQTNHSRSESLPQPELNEAATEVISQFTDPDLICGSVSLLNPDEESLLESALQVARKLQLDFGLTVGWCTRDNRRLSKIAETNHFKQYDVELTPVAPDTSLVQRVGLLIVDNLADFTPRQLQELDSQVDAQIVLGLASERTSIDINECFDQNLEVNWEWNESGYLVG